MARYAGKFFGAGMGFMVGGPLGAILGGAIGHMFDSSPAPGTGGPPRPEPGATREGFLFLSNLVAILTLVAKADGKIQPEEVRTIRKFFETQMRYDSRDLDLIRTLMQETARVNPDLEQVCREFRRISRYEDLLILMRMIYMVALADRNVHPEERKTIDAAAAYLGIGEADHRAIRGEFLGDENRAFQILGLDSNASNDKIRKAYKEMAIKYHPDKVSHLGEEFQQLATEKFRKINDSYQEIRKQRGF